jgi:hypothetical protein
MILKKVISGGQDGADTAGLMAARHCNIETSGFIPIGCLTLSGPNVDRAKQYNLIEFGDYKERTFKNVNESDATIRFASDWNSSGEKCTLKAIKLCNKPYLDIPIRNFSSIADLEFERVCTWLNENHVETLNIAGNAPDKSANITVFVYSYLTKLFTMFDMLV